MKLQRLKNYKKIIDKLLKTTIIKITEEGEMNRIKRKVMRWLGIKTESEKLGEAYTAQFNRVARA